MKRPESHHAPRNAAQNSASGTSARPHVNVAAVARLRQAVRNAGGNQALAERSGVPLATVNNYVRGRHGMKMDTLAALAAACGVTLEWLVSGDGAPTPGFAPVTPAAPPGLADAPPAPAPVARDAIDVPALAKAIEIVRAVTGGSALADAPEVLARRIASAYAVLTQPSAAPDQTDGA